MKKITTLGIGLTGLAALGLAVTPSLVNAKSGANTNGARGYGGGYEQMIQSKAKILKMTTTELKNQLQTKTMLQIADAQGVSEDQFHAAMKETARQRWVDKGLTQAEIDSRLQRMEERQAGDHAANSVNRGGMRYGR